MIPAYVHFLRAKDLMDRRYAEPLDVAALARVALASESHFSRSFRRAFGETPHRYLQCGRIERAAELLRETRDPVSDVCLAVGFRSLGSFSAAFRDVMGESPSAYRARMRSAPRALVPACYALMWTRPLGGADRADLEKRADVRAASVAGGNDQEVQRSSAGSRTRRCGCSTRTRPCASTRRSSASRCARTSRSTRSVGLRSARRSSRTWRSSCSSPPHR